MNLRIEKYYWQKGYQNIIGFDEAGRGSLAGPLTIGAVILKSVPNFQFSLSQIRDSKKLSEKQREKIFKIIKKSSFILFAHTSVWPKVIDKINIENATKIAIKRCLKKLLPKQNRSKILILIDGNKILNKKLKIHQRAIIRGDNKILTLALASIIAKVSRDRIMKRLAKKNPLYKFEIHKGYPTKLHKKLLKKYGPSKIHRKSYKLTNN